MTTAYRIVVNGQFNIGHICTRQQCDSGLGAKVAMSWVSHDLTRTQYTFRDLDLLSNKFANALRSLGLEKGDIAFTYLPKMPEQFIAFLGALKVEIIAGTLFSNFGEDALLHRLGDAKAKCIITKKSLAKKITRIRERLPELRHVVIVDGEDDPVNGLISYNRLLEEASPDFTTAVTEPDTPSVIHYTSGSTGKPKGVLHRHGSIIHQSRTARQVLDLQPYSRLWCTADQGWVTGTSYGIIGPWSLGVTQIHYGGAYDAAVWLDILERERVTVWYTAPTALRMLMQEDAALFSRLFLGALQHIFSVGEPLNPEIIRWARRAFKKDIYDTWFQTETGGIMITNRPGLEIRPGSMGKPVVGIDAVILTDDGKIAAYGEPGNLCIKPGCPSMFVTYLNHDSTYREKFRYGYYFTGDTASVDMDGYFWFLGRSDDVINTAGHLVSPFEVESALLELDEIAESGVIGVPDEVLFEKVVAFVKLHKEYQWSKELELKFRLHVSNKVSSIATPQEIIVGGSIPKNKSGKIMRRFLKSSFLGTDAGDISTLENWNNEPNDAVQQHFSPGI